MAVITLFSASHCHGEELLQKLSETLPARILTNEQLLSEAAARFQVAEDKLRRAMHGPRSIFDRLTQDRRLHIAYLKFTLADLIKDDQVIYHGFAGHLLPRSLTHVLSVCLVAKDAYREQNAIAKEKISAKEAQKILGKDDQSAKQWTLSLFGLSPWDKSLYDIVLPMDSTTIERAAELIYANAGKAPLQFTPAADQAMKDFLLASQVDVALAEQGHEVETVCSDGQVRLTINRYVMRLERHEKELSQIAAAVPGVKMVKTMVGPHFNQPNIYPKIDLPKKILLVDDEKEFVQTLSERLQTRNLESAIAYDGEQALSIMETDPPEVMVLDLKMPGIDGLEVLRQVKQKHPATEVIILTGHGSEAEEKLAAEMGAFAYLRKPADIDLLTKSMKDAYQKVAQNQAQQDQDPK